MRIIKFALPLAAMVCLGPIGTSAKDTSSPSEKSSSGESGTRKKSSSSKKSAKTRKSSKSSKAKSRQATGKGKGKAQKNAAGMAASKDLADRLPPEELPEAEDVDDDSTDAEAEP